MNKVNYNFDFNKNSLTVGVGDFKIAADGYKLKTLLGCCVCICLYHKSRKLGGLLHIMLPSAPVNNKLKPARYADTGIREILRAFKKKYGIFENSLVAKIFGGAKMIQVSTQDIGKSNVKKASEALRKHKIKIIKEKVGGEKGYRIEFDISTGMVTCQIFGEREKKY